ncbi:RNA exonuclease 1 [Cryptococcus deuterogattii 2001/935-1]|nr:RNA exonuclease 1 [Cryptococcus deuterogattii 2001/935-1]
MLSNLGLFATERCPDTKCTRPRCFFSHNLSISSPSQTQVPVGFREPAPRKAPTAVKRKLGESSSAAVAMEVKKQNVTSVTKPVAPSSATIPVRSAPPAPTKTIVSAGSSSSSTDYSRPPMLPYGVKLSPQPRTDRQKALGTLHTQFAKLYSQILHLSPSLAHDSSLAQEAEISSSSTSLRAYKTAIHHAAVAISRRPPPTGIPHPSIGTVKESRIAMEKDEKEKASKLTRDRVERYCMKKEDFEKWGYPDPSGEGLTGTGVETKPDGEGETHNCDRCKMSFIVSSKNLEERFGECRYHYGRTAPERVEGRRKWIYSCCGKERGEQGCEEGIHVFKDGEDDKELAKRVAYKTVRMCLEDAKASGKNVVGEGYGVVAMDCEMIFTTAGLSLGRVTVVDENGHTILDELVRQKVPILDINTRFSGISPGQLDNAIMDLDGVRAAVCMFIGPETIIVGHGLENDLRALRLLHDQVIDTAIVFPHDKGAPYRRALRDIVKEKLGYFIQDRTSDKGHSSVEDAKATLEVLKWKVREDNED